MTASDVSVVFRKDYEPPTYWVDRVAMEFDLAPDRTLVRSQLSVRRNENQASHRLELNGEQLELVSLSVDGEQLDESRYKLTDSLLTIDDLPDQCVVETRVAIDPAANKTLYGLYQSSGIFCTQCEALGFRKITWFPDRPDVMSRYSVTIRADRQDCPVLLSNGNRVAERVLDDGRLEVEWEDPFRKPCYLFALVAGNLKCHRGTFTTRSGRAVDLEIWVEPQNINKCEHALVSLQKSMKWDEDTFGLEYDLDTYMIVAVNDFNMGAMENKGLNIFNSKFVLALPETATDDDYLNIEAVIAHEYFHNWTGNRVTCRDWFQLTLKEGLTVFRDQQFTADQTSPAVKRIDDVEALRSRQFLEDAGPMAHPIRPESYISMDNFYTATVYDKGAEIIRIYHSLLGDDGFRRGMDLYFERHDGCAVTCDDFRAAMADANDIDLAALDRWYSQPGTPELRVAGQWSPDRATFTLTFEQSYPPLRDDIPGAANRQPVPIPIALGLLDRTGQALPMQLEGEESASAKTRVLLMKDRTATFTFTKLPRRPIPSVLRGFSAPVRLNVERSDDELTFLMKHEPDPFNRWDAAQTFATRMLLKLSEERSRGSTVIFPGEYLEAFGKVLADESLDNAFRAVLLTLPSEIVLGQELAICNPDTLHFSREYLRRTLAIQHRDAIEKLYVGLSGESAGRNDSRAINSRRLKNVLLSYLACSRDSASVQHVADQFATADNMTDSQAALSILCHLDCPQRWEAIDQFYQRWQNDPLVLDKWFVAQALSKRSDTIERVTDLTGHPDFRLSNPNRVRSLIGAFTQNQVRFHDKSGTGYTLVADMILKIDPNNPQLAARLTSAFNSYRRFDENRQAKMRAELERIAAQPALSKDVYEIVERALKF